MFLPVLAVGTGAPLDLELITAGLGLFFKDQPGFPQFAVSHYQGIQEEDVADLDGGIIAVNAVPLVCHVSFKGFPGHFQVGDAGQKSLSGFGDLVFIQGPMFVQLEMGDIYLPVRIFPEPPVEEGVIDIVLFNVL